MKPLSRSVNLVARKLHAAAEERLCGFPILTITGPRQSGKTTLARSLRPELPYFSLEDPDNRAFASEDPRGFLRQMKAGAILDEVQRVPDLFSYLQGEVDARRDMGRFILTGSSQFHLMESVTQSLAGRSAVLTLLPFSLSELQAAGRAPKTIDDLLWRGLFPPIYDRPVNAAAWLQDYVSTYVERDVRAILNIQRADVFQRFVVLCANRCGQLLNLTSLASDAGVTRATAERWLTVLEASYLIFRVRPWSRNLSKRLIKSEKLYFCDPGLFACLLGVRKMSHLSSHPQRGFIFENWVMTELLKAQVHRGRKGGVYFLRDKQGNEVDALVEDAPGRLHAIEIKSGATVVSGFFDGLDYWANKIPDVKVTPWLIYGGETEQQRKRGRVLPWDTADELFDRL